jgi:hypothetical protein
MVFVADAFASWLVEQVADVGRKRLVTWALGSDQERALRQAAAAAVQRTAEELRPASSEEAAHVAMVVGHVFIEPVRRSVTGQATLLEAIRAGIAFQMAPLSDAGLTGTGVSSAELLGVSAATLAEELAGHLLWEITVRGADGGPLAPLASQLNHDLTHLTGERVEGKIDWLSGKILEAISGIDYNLTKVMSITEQGLSSSDATAEGRHLEERPQLVTDHVQGSLPARGYTNLVGREKQVGEILSGLRRRDHSAPVVVTITGLGGIGKTALAYEVVMRALDEGLFDGVVWESAKAEELITATIHPLNSPTISYESLLVTIAHQIGLRVSDKISISELEARLRVLLNTKAYLIVVDNLETVDAYRTLAERVYSLISSTDPEQPTRALFTSRERLVDIPYVHDYYIQGLSKSDSGVFVRQEAADRRASGLRDAAPALLDQIYEITQGMPLAMKLVVSQYLLGLPVDTELARLKGAEEKELYRFLYLRLWFRLSTPAQKVLISTAAFAAPVARFMLQPVSCTADNEFIAAVLELVRMSLLEPSEHVIQEQRRYAIHQITRWFVRAPLRELWEEQRGGAREEA